MDFRHACLQKLLFGKNYLVVHKCPLIKYIHFFLIKTFLLQYYYPPLGICESPTEKTLNIIYFYKLLSKCQRAVITKFRKVGKHSQQVQLLIRARNVISAVCVSISNFNMALISFNSNMS